MINNRLKEILKALKIKQKDLSFKTGIDEATMSNFNSSGKKYIHLKNLETIANAIGMSISDILNLTIKGSWCLSIINGSGAIISSFENLSITELKSLISLCLKCDKKTIIWNQGIKDKIDGKAFLKSLESFN